MNQFNAPKTNKELVTYLENISGSTFLLGGGTDLSIYIKNNNIHNFTLIDLTKINENKTIQLTDKTIEIGSAVTISKLLSNTAIKHNFPALQEACNTLGSTQIRNIATLGGNIVNASQSADTLPVLLAHQAYCILLNKNGSIQKTTLRLPSRIEGKSPR